MHMFQASFALLTVATMAAEAAVPYLLLKCDIYPDMYTTVDSVSRILSDYLADSCDNTCNVVYCHGLADNPDFGLHYDSQSNSHQPNPKASSKSGYYRRQVSILSCRRMAEHLTSPSRLSGAAEAIIAKARYNATSFLMPAREICVTLASAHS